MSGLLLAAVAAFVLLGAAMQRITGMGFALVASPLLVLALGTHDGVQLTQVLGMLASALVLVQVWRDVEWRRAGLLLACALVGIGPGAWVASRLPGPVLSIGIGLLVIVALLATTLGDRVRLFRGPSGLPLAGLVSGFMNVTAGVGGPAIVVFARSTGWAQAAFLASMQPYFVGLSGASLLAAGWPRLGSPLWAAALVAMVVGLVLGELLSRRVSPARARTLVLVVALLGALATVVKGVTGLL